MNIALIIGGTLSAIAGVAHLACIYFGVPWYRFFGAGEQMAAMAQQGSIQPALITLGVATVLFIWSLYAFTAGGVDVGSAIGLSVKLPFVRLVLVAVTCVYLLRGIVGFLFVANPIGRTPEFWVWSSIICLAFAIVHAVGLVQQWSRL